ncbi:hypothetical protein AGMMS50293_14290 [Spirochaetia bacterium]|nr:hypothetical protein AGMMS50293_14290 [Spirochaetia bacterium]
MKNTRFGFCVVFAGLLAAFVPTFESCAGMAASAEEYYSIGMAYFDMGKFDEAEKWLNRAKTADKTKVASEYNLGRIAYETGRYREAAGHFETILKRDPQNTLALRAAAYTRIKNGEIELAEKHYNRLLTLAPESADDGYNYALVLYAMEKYADAEKVLGSYQFALQDNSDMLLLYARSQKAQDKIEAIDNYAKWLADNSDAKVRYEYAQMLEGQELYARALEEYRSTLSGLNQDSVDPKKSELRFTIARLLLIADSESADGITELTSAVSEGYDDIDAMEELLKDSRISAANKESLRGLINDVQRAAEEKEKKAAMQLETKAKAAVQIEAEAAAMQSETEVETEADSTDE